jgi:hypothetical protein
MTQPDDGPRSELARYAYGYSDKKPGRIYWIIQAVMALVALFSVLDVRWP